MTGSRSPARWRKSQALRIAEREAPIHPRNVWVGPGYFAGPPWGTCGELVLAAGRAGLLADVELRQREDGHAIRLADLDRLKREVPPE